MDEAHPHEAISAIGSGQDPITQAQRATHQSVYSFWKHTGMNPFGPITVSIGMQCAFAVSYPPAQPMCVQVLARFLRAHFHHEGTDKGRFNRLRFMDDTTWCIHLEADLRVFATNLQKAGLLITLFSLGPK